MAIDYRAPPIQSQISLLARTFPDGRIWNAKYDRSRVLGRLVAAFAQEINRTFSRISDFVLNELDPKKTRQLILEWEESVGIPDRCFGRPLTLEDRRMRVIQKLNNFGDVITNEDMVAFFASFGEDIEIVPGTSENAVRFGFPAAPHTRNQLKLIKHTVAIRVRGDANTFDLPFDFPFSAGGSEVLRCLIRRLLPANIAPQFFFNQDLSVPF